MTKKDFRELQKEGVLLLDGATGTNLQKAGMPVGVCPEQWIIEHPEVLTDLQRQYVQAGTNILLAPTFTANRIKLAEYGLESQLVEINRQLVALSKQAAGEALVAGDLTMTGRQLYPLGDLLFEELVQIYKEQVRVIADAGVDLFIVETMMSLQECRAAVLAVRETCDLPVLVSLTYNEDGRTLYGTDPKTAVVVLQSLGADAVGMNCSTGPYDMLGPVKEMAEYATVPILAKPNAGMPQLENGVTIYCMEPEEFAVAGRELVSAGVSVIGGCCGTTPAHIRALKDAVKDMTPGMPLQCSRRVLASERKSVEIVTGDRFLVIGERINPTGKKKLQAELRDGKLDLVRQMAMEQEENGAAILDINMGMNGIDEKQMMLEAVYEVTSASDCPLCIDSSYTEVIEAALRIYPGRALINSISMEHEKIEKLLPIAVKYGAMFILLPLSDEGLPEDTEQKHKIIRDVMDRAIAAGMKKEDIIVDGLVATVGANQNAALDCFRTFAYCSENLGLPTVCGLSNISFGLPERSYVNTAFLTMAIANGLTMAIANPSQELLMNAAYASDLLLAKKESDIRYIDRMNFLSEKYEGMERVYLPAAGKSAAGTGGEKTDCVNGSAEAGAKITPVYEAVLKGNKNTIIDEVKAELDRGSEPEEILNGQLIAAINEVGVLFEQQKYFLPQLISSANSMKLAIEYLEPKLKQANREEKAKIVVATVEGDIHDIGKNLVVLMLKNYGYHVTDLGKDVPADLIVETAIREEAKVIGLSALMTTTMMRMKDVVLAAKEKGCTAKIVIGGAAITESFAKEIGADGYSKDAAECVRLVERLLKEAT